MAVPIAQVTQGRILVSALAMSPNVRIHRPCVRERSCARKWSGAMRC